MKWTTGGDLRRQVERLWERGLILQALLSEEPLFPRRLVLKTPGTTELVHQFNEVRDWCRALLRTPQVRFEHRIIQHRVIGANALPFEAWIDTPACAARFIGKNKELETFQSIVGSLRARCASLLPWVLKRPLQVLEYEEAWPQILDLIDWMVAHPRPGCYLRQVDVPGVHSKFIEQHRGLLAELFDLVLPAERLIADATGVSGFAARYGFKDKPVRVRLRVLDPAYDPLRLNACSDLTLNVTELKRLPVTPRRLFITENEVNFLAFPEVPGTWILFGAGYGFGGWDALEWLRGADVRYWGDIDTHGFAVLDELRGILPQVRSFLMDKETLLSHRAFWQVEPKQCNRDLQRLTAEEYLLYNELRDQVHGSNVRLEQERVAYSRVLRHTETCWQS